MKNSNVTLWVLVVLSIIAGASLALVAKADLGVETCGLRDTVNWNCLDDLYVIEKPELKVYDRPSPDSTDIQLGQNRVQKTRHQRTLQGGW